MTLKIHGIMLLCNVVLTVYVNLEVFAIMKK